MNFLRFRMSSRLKLRDRMIAMSLLTSVIPVILFAIYFYQSNRAEATEQTVADTLGTIRQLNSNIANQLDAYAKITSLLYLDDRLADYMSVDYGDPRNRDLLLSAYQYINGRFGNIHVLHPDISELVVYTANTSIPSDGQYVKHMSERSGDDAWFAQVDGAKGNVVFSGPHQDGRGNPVISLGRSLNLLNLNYPYGTLVLSIKESEFYSFIEKNKKHDIYVADASGTILTGSDRTLIGAGMAAVLGEAYGAMGARTGSVESSYGGKRALIVYDTLPNGWRTYAFVPHEEFLSATSKSARGIVLLSLFSLLFSSVIIVLYSRAFTGRIERLLRMMRRLETENFDPLSGENGRDEIGYLTLSFQRMAGRLKELINEVYKKEIAKKEAEMNMLQAQINPHFLYNTLYSISALAAMRQDNPVSEMAAHLARFYRVSLNKGRHVITLREELELTKSYVSIQQLRFENQFRIAFQTDESLLDVPTIKLILQPFIENAINHAIWDPHSAVGIVVKAYREEDYLRLDVIDDGMGMTAETLAGINRESESGEGGYGIRNVRERIRLHYGPDSDVTVSSRLGMGTRVSIRIPLGPEPGAARGAEASG